MNRRRFIGVLAASATTALAGCPTDNQDVPQGTPAPTTADAEPATTEEPATNQQTTVAVRSTEEYGDVLVDSEGMSLYLFTQDDGGESTCYDGCAENWPPLTVEGEPSAGTGVTADLGTTERTDGSLQVTAGGKPLYYFVNDSQPGDTNGQAVGDVWYLLAPDGSQISGSSATTADATTEDSDSDGGNGGGTY